MYEIVNTVLYVVKINENKKETEVRQSCGMNLLLCGFFLKNDCDNGGQDAGRRVRNRGETGDERFRQKSADLRNRGKREMKVKGGTVNGSGYMSTHV